MHLTSSLQNQSAYDIWAATYDLDRPPHSYLEEPIVLRELNLNSNDIVLDAACGTGRYARTALEKGAQVSACDFSERMLSEAKRLAPAAEFQQVDLCQSLPYADTTFSKIICSLAIRHIESMQACLGEFRRVLMDDGVCVFTSIHPEMDWSSYERREPPPIELNTEGKTFSYTIAEMKTAAMAAGFENIGVIEIEADSTVSNWLTEVSAIQQIGKKFVAAFICRKTSPS